MKFIKNTLATLLIIYSMGALSCDALAGKAFPSLNVEDGMVVFDENPIEKDPGDTSTYEQIGIDVSFFNCSDGTKKLIGQLPFLASTGKVRAAFFAQAEPDAQKSLFIIHSVEIRSDTGVKYSGDYYTANIYKQSESGYIRDERLSMYFGDGGDILSDDYKELSYIYPYKTQSSITEKLATENYKTWIAGTTMELTINKKTSLYSAPTLTDITNMYLIKGDKVKQKNVEAGWISILFKTPKGKEIRGWIKCENTDGC